MILSFKIMVLNWNGAKLTMDCLDSLKKVNYANYSVSVIDNGSSDNSVELIRAAHPDIELLTLDRNYGYAGGYNRAIARLAGDQTDFYVLLNNDTLVAPDFLAHLAAAAEKYGRRNIFGVKIFYAEKPEIIWYAGGRVSMQGLRIAHIGIRQRDSSRYSRDIQTDYITGCCLMITPVLFEELGGFDEGFGMYAEDVDLCLRARDRGARCYMIHSAHIQHRVSASTGGNLSLQKNIRKLISRARLYKKQVWNR
ncbi:MAG: glycosyltransferase family 2 protein [FCB group bacterium]|nr:glycosyltransferase family 2 protein [FCB group bacterium]